MTTADSAPSPFEPPASDAAVVWWLDTIRAALAEAAAKRRTAEQTATKDPER